MPEDERPLKEVGKAGCKVSAEALAGLTGGWRLGLSRGTRLMRPRQQAAPRSSPAKPRRGGSEGQAPRHVRGEGAVPPAGRRKPTERVPSARKGCFTVTVQTRTSSPLACVLAETLQGSRRAAGKWGARGHSCPRPRASPWGRPPSRCG